MEPVGRAAMHLPEDANGSHQASDNQQGPEKGADAQTHEPSGNDQGQGPGRIAHVERRRSRC